MFPNLKIYAVITLIVLLVIGGLSTALYLSNKAVEAQSGAIAKLQVQVDAAKASMKALEDDSLQTAKNQVDLFGQLDDIRTEAKTDQNKIVIPAKILHDKSSKPVEVYINAHTKAVLHKFEVLTTNGKK